MAKSNVYFSREFCLVCGCTFNGNEYGDDIFDLRLVYRVEGYSE